MARIFIRSARKTSALWHVKVHPSFQSDLTFFNIKYRINMSLEDQRGITFFVFKSLPNNSYGDDYYAVIEDETLAYLILTYGIVEPATVSLPPRKYAFAKKRKLPGFPGYGK